ncbi:unnamed protein product, partial [marine sediment metagenome]
HTLPQNPLQKSLLCDPTTQQAFLSAFILGSYKL